MNGAAIGGNQVELYNRGPGLRDPTYSRFMEFARL